MIKKAMNTLADCLEKLFHFKQQFGSVYGINRIGIFGSVARQENTKDSDIDIVVEIEKPTLSMMYNLRQALTELFGCEVDVVRMRKSLDESFRSTIERDVVYA